MALKTISPKILQVGSYGVAQPDVPIRVDEKEAKKLLATGNWVEGKTDRAKAREKAARERAAAEAKAEEERAAAEEEAKRKAAAAAKPNA